MCHYQGNTNATVQPLIPRVRPTLHPAMQQCKYATAVATIPTCQHRIGCSYYQLAIASTTPMQRPLAMQQCQCNNATTQMLHCQHNSTPSSKGGTHTAAATTQVHKTASLAYHHGSRPNHSRVFSASSPFYFLLLSFFPAPMMLLQGCVARHKMDWPRPDPDSDSELCPIAVTQSLAMSSAAIT